MMKRPLRRVAVVSGEFEQDFEQRYGVNLNLPIHEEKFLSIVEELGLEYASEGPVSLDLPNKLKGIDRPTPPVHSENYDMSEISHSYKVYGGYNHRARRQETYLALVRRDMMVVYVENYFGYRVP